MNILSYKYADKTSAVLTGGAEKASKYNDVINLCIGDPDIKTPQIILDLAYKDVSDGFTKYSDGKGYNELRDELLSYYRDEYGISLLRENISVTTSGGYALFQALRVTLNPLDEVIIFEPYFSPYKGQVELAGGVPVFVPTYENEAFQIDFSRLENAVTAKTRGIIINTPCNPSGAAYSLDTLKALALFAQKHNLLVYADDIYTAFCYDSPFVPIMSLENMFERTITINSFSKNYIMTGFRLANIVAPAYVLNAISSVNDVLVFSPPCYSQRAGIHALRHRHEFTKEIVDLFKKRLDYSVERIGKMKNIHVLPPKGAFYLFPNIKATGKSSDEITDLLFEKAHILVTPGNAFGESGEGYIRICATVEIPVLKEVFDRMEALDIFNPNV